jgi:hypothetical protein
MTGNSAFTTLATKTSAPGTQVTALSAAVRTLATSAEALTTDGATLRAQPGHCPRSADILVRFRRW